MKKTLITILTLMMVLCISVSAFAAEFEAGKHADSSVVNIKGRIEPDDIVKTSKVTVAIVEDLGLATERVAYATELEVNEAGIYETKFKCVATDNSVLKVCYNGEVINDSLIEADINGVSKLLNMDIVILSDRGGAFNQKDWGEMPVIKYNSKSRGIVDATYQASYKFKETEGVQAYIKAENLYGFSERFTPIVACYDESNKLLGTRIFDEETIGFYDKTKVVQTDIIDLPEGTVRAKAFAWNKDKLIPMGDSNEGELDKINIVLVGASTAQDWPRDIVKGDAKHYPIEGFGRFLGNYFNPEYVNYYNESVSGASTTSFLDEKTGKGYWPNVMRWVEPGTIVIIELGPNDKGDTLGENGKFSPEMLKANLLTMYNDVRNAGGEVIFVGVSVDANKFVDNKIYLENAWTCELNHYKEEFAELVGADYITCEQALADFYNKEVERLGSPANVVGYYFRDSRYMLGEFDTDEIKYSFEGITPENVYTEGNFEEKADRGYAYDATHTNIRGAEVVAQKFYEAIVASDSILKAYTK